MSEEAVADDIDDFDDEEKPAKKMSGKKLVLFIALPLLLVGGGAGVFMSGMLGGGAEEKPAAAEAEGPTAPKKTVFYDLPEMLVNLNTKSRRPSYLKISISLELDSEAHVARLESLQPRIIDNFQVYLRELRIEDLRGSAGIYRLREELLARINTAVHPAEIRDVLFKEVLVQ